MPTGIVRKVDDLGRVVLPKEMCRTLGIGVRDPVDIYMDDGRIVIEPLHLQCVRCGISGKAGQVEVAGVTMCRSCAQAVLESLMRSKGNNGQKGAQP